MKKLLAALALLTLCAGVPLAQAGKPELHSAPLEYRGDTCTGEVTAVNGDTREITLTCAEGGETRTFVGVLGKRYKVKIKGGSKQEVKVADLPGKRVTVDYLPKGEMDVNGVKVEAHEVLLILILPNEHARPEEMKGLTKVFVNSGADPKDRGRIVKEIESAKLGLAVLDSAEGAEIILDFGSRTELHDDNVPIYSYQNPTWIIGRLQVRKEVLIGRGRVSVVKDGKPRIVMSFEDTKTATAFWDRAPATNFGKTFAKAYRRAHGAK
jgi:hypothetical protein